MVPDRPTESYVEATLVEVGISEGQEGPYGTKELTTVTTVTVTPLGCVVQTELMWEYYLPRESAFSFSL